MAQTTIEVHESLKDEPLDELIAALARIGPAPRRVQSDHGVFNTPDCFLPAVIAISLFGPDVLAGFLKEIGADAARSLKSGLIDAFSKARSKSIRWRRGSENKRLLKELRAAELDQREPQTSGIGRSAAPLSIELQISESKDLSLGVAKAITVRLVFPGDVTEEQFARSLDTINRAVSQAKETASSRVELDREIAALAMNDPAAAFALRVSERSTELSHEFVYVYRPTNEQWLDAHQETRKEARENIEARKRRRKRSK